MPSKIYANDLKVGMFVADLDRPWVDTPFLLQGFLIENDEQIHALRKHCEWVIVDRARSTGTEYEAVAGAGPVAVNRAPAPARITPNAQGTEPQSVTPLAATEAKEARAARPKPGPAAASAALPASAPKPVQVDTSGYGSTAARGPGFLARLFSGLKGGRRKDGSPAGPAAPEIFRE